MQCTTGKPRSLSIKPIFLRPRDGTRTPNHQPVVQENNHRSRKSHPAERRDSYRVSKASESDKHQSPNAILADDFSASLDQYRENVRDQANKDLGNVEKHLINGLKVLSVDVESHFEHLAQAEEPLQRPFAAESLAHVQSESNTHHVEKMLLHDRISNFRKVREEKEMILCKLWDEWEDIQFELIRLGVEVFPPESIAIAQVQDDNLKPGQKERLLSTFDSARKAREDTGNHYESLEQDLDAFEENLVQFGDKTKKTMTEMQQQYNVQKNKLFQGLNRHIELLAAL